MYGWTGNILRINLTSRTHKVESFDEEFAKKWVGGRGFALKILWDELKPGIDPLGPENKLIVTVGPIAGIPAPNTGKTVVAAKSPLTGGYADGNLGTRVTEQMRKAGYDIIIIEGKSDKPVYLYIEDDRIEYLPADEIWGKGTYDTQSWLYKKYGKGAGVLSIGQGGENLNLYAMVRSLEGRAGGRPGIGAVMGSKKLKAIVIKGSRPIPVADPEGMRKLGLEDLRKVGEIDKKTGWSIQGTTGVLAWCNEVAALPVHNMRKTHHPDAWKIDGERLNNARVATYGCPNCTMRCGITILDYEGRESELDYENIGMLGSNLDIFELDQVASLNYLCDDYGLDTISAGAVLAFYADAIEQGAIKGDFRFGDAEMAKKLLGMAAKREGEIGNLLADGTLRMARKIGHNSEAYAMQVKGLEISAYNCKFIPGMALAFGTSPIGAHHKESWVITFELKQTARDSYGPEKAAKVIELQRIRGGLFEFIVACRFPWIELGWDLEHYAEYFNKTTGLNWTLNDFWKVADRIYALMKFFWVREFPFWDRTRDYPPMIWFDPNNADTDGPIAGKVLELDKYNQLLDYYYEQRGWDKRGIPTRKTAEALDLKQEADEVEKFTKLA
ncbi:MAG: aldehyde ferredoxin oxidoreductase family protein [Candidatus Saccharicenans sp.]|uniref:aldehyde ferredoxin oxidoreductase family protein n=1 Tax=Candidatus Saccharicenans sp. TaxID=2819258 RepID=UPI00404B0091